MCDFCFVETDLVWKSEGFSARGQYFAVIRWRRVRKQPFVSTYRGGCSMGLRSIFGKYLETFYTHNPVYGGELIVFRSGANY